jgi:putative transposase
MQTMIPLKPGGFYHIYNRGINRGNIFFEERNYPYFLGLFAKYIIPVADAHAFCLLRNHFHFLVGIKPQSALGAASVTKAFNNLYTAYVKAINKTYNRTGALFQHHFGRIPITSDQYFMALVRYIHRNPQKHGLVKNFRDWPFSSYHTLLSQETTLLARESVLGWFGGAGRFQRYHQCGGWNKKILECTGNDSD